MATNDIEAKVQAVAAWPHEQVVKLAQELLQQNAELQARLSAARELLNEYRRGLK